MAGSPDSHADHMDGIYRYQRYIYDASRKFYLLGRDAMVEGLQPPAGGTVLEVGCGTGRNLIMAAKRYRQAQFYGFDISKMMLETAQTNVDGSGLAKRVVLAQGDASAFSGEALFGVAQFDRVYISYAVSMIPPWQAAVEQAFAAVKPGGSLHIVDFGQQTDLPTWFKAGLHGWLAKFTVTPRAELEAELQALAQRTGATLAFKRLYRDYAQLAVVMKVA
ncbi:MAG: class I SAM-dependent methyltransferase [Hyphomicrobiaceae bacterium]